jgi:uncharacterized Ntn-hydrolase superfamily protein
VQSAWFAVGHDVPWVNAGVGVVATQAFVEPAYGPRGLTLMRNGLSAPRTLDALIEIDDGRRHRQVAMIDSEGRVASYTGDLCITHAGHAVGHQVSCQGNVLARPGIPELMVEAYESADGEIVDRLMAALEAAEEAGGDARGRQSAALQVVAGTGSRDLYADRLYDLRIDDHPDPVSELRRVIDVQKHYRMLDLGHQRLARGDVAEAYELVMRCVEDMPEDPNAIVMGVTVAFAAGERERAAEIGARISRVDINWDPLIRGLAAAGDFGDAPIEEVLAVFALEQDSAAGQNPSLTPKS